MGILIAYIVVFLLAATPFFEVVAVIPLGALAGLNTFLVTVVGLLGNLLTVFLVVFLTEKLTGWLERRRERKGKEPSRRGTRAQKIWNKYGLIGLAVSGPILVGSHLAAFLSMSFGGDKKRVMVWMAGSLIFWAGLAGILTELGLDIFYQGTERNGFLVEWLESIS